MSSPSGAHRAHLAPVALAGALALIAPLVAPPPATAQQACGANWTLNADPRQLTPPPLSWSAPADDVDAAPDGAIMVAASASYWDFDGDEILTTPRAARWDGNGWQYLPLPYEQWSTRLEGVAVLSAADAFAVGTTAYVDVWTPPLIQWHWNAWILRWNGTAWAKMPVPIATAILHDVAATGPNDAWAVGGTALSGSSPVVMHWNGTAWTGVTVPLPAGATGGTLVDVEAIAPDNVWVAGHYFASTGYSKSLLLRWNGVVWKAKTWSSAGVLSWVEASGPDNVYLGSGGAWVKRFNGSLFTTVKTGLTSVQGALVRGPSDVFVSGNGSRHFNGVVWQVMNAPFTAAHHVVQGGDLQLMVRTSGDTALRCASAPVFVPPAAPASASAAVSGDTIIVSWTDGDDAGSPITGAWVTAVPTTTAATTLRAHVAEHTATLAPGVAGATYTTTIVSENSGGPGAGRTITVTVPPPPPAGGLPGMPTRVTATWTNIVGGNGDIIVSWRPAAKGGSSITDYEIVFSAPGQGTQVDSTGGTTYTKRLGGLPRTVPWTMTVRAVNDLGTGPESLPIVLPAS